MKKFHYYYAHKFPVFFLVAAVTFNPTAAGSYGVTPIYDEYAAFVPSAGIDSLPAATLHNSNNLESPTNNNLGNTVPAPSSSSSSGYYNQPAVTKGAFPSRPGPFTRNHWLSSLPINNVLLEDLNVFNTSVTLSGFQSGASISQSLFVSYPSLFRGLAVFQQTFYRCGRANGNVTEFDSMCTNLPAAGSNASNCSNAFTGGNYNPSLALDDIQAYFHNGLIEDPKNMRNKYLYIYAGLRNPLFRADQMLATVSVFQPHIQNIYHIKTRVQDAHNLLPTAGIAGGDGSSVGRGTIKGTGGPACFEPAHEMAYVGNCQLNGPFEALSWLLAEDAEIRLPISSQVDRKSPAIDVNSLLAFDQTEFFGDAGSNGNGFRSRVGSTAVKGFHSLASTGYLYVPKGCGPNGEKKCQVHVYFHGCRTGVEFNDGMHIKHSGWLELAELNQVILVFPQIAREERNPMGCWDSYGYTGPLYATQKGVQVQILRRILDRIVGRDL